MMGELPVRPADQPAASAKASRTAPQSTRGGGGGRAHEEGVTRQCAHCAMCTGYSSMLTYADVC
jgi:hypothetical protein